MTVYGLPFFLEDKTGSTNGSEFIDIHDRMHLNYRCTANNALHTAFMIYNATADSYSYSTSQRPIVALDFGPNHALGSVSFSGKSVEMKKFLVPASSRYPKGKKFVASDGQEYTWSWRVQDGQEWTCTNSSSYLVAYYSLRTPGEPVYESSSGCTLTVDEAFGHLAPEMLATLMIMRHIARYNV